MYRISVPYAEKDTRFLFIKSTGRRLENRPLVSEIACSTLLYIHQDCEEEQLYAIQKVITRGYTKLLMYTMY